LGNNIETIKKNAKTVIDASKGVGLEVNSEKTRYILLSHHQNAGQNHNIEVINNCRSFGNVAKFKYLEKRVTNYMELRPS
jgi:hypothetical protein